jgi:hypothetical protein
MGPYLAIWTPLPPHHWPPYFSIAPSLGPYTKTLVYGDCFVWSSFLTTPTIGFCFQFFDIEKINKLSQIYIRKMKVSPKKNQKIYKIIMFSPPTPPPPPPPPKKKTIETTPNLLCLSPWS